jgi:hypothetical protein
VANRRPGLAPWLPPLACVVAIAWLFSASLFGSKALSAADLVFFEPPFVAQRPPGLVRPSNPGLTDPVFIYQPHWRLIRDQLADGRLPHGGSG